MIDMGKNMLSNKIINVTTSIVHVSNDINIYIKKYIIKLKNNLNVENNRLDNK